MGNRDELVGNSVARKGLTILAIRIAALLCMLGAFGALMAKVSDGWELDPYVNEGIVSKARVLGSARDTSTIVWNNGDRGQTSYNFVRVVTEPADGIAFGDFNKVGQRPALPAPPDGEPTEAQTRSLSVDDTSFAEVQSGDIVDVVTHRYDNSGGMLLSEITGRDYTVHYALIAIFVFLATGLWLLANRIRRA